MRIDLNTRIPQLEDSGQSASTARNAPGSVAGGRAEDSAELSSAQGRVSALATAANQLPEIRQDKVAALAKVIAQGTYAVTPEQTAAALFSAMQSYA